MSEVAYEKIISVSGIHRVGKWLFSHYCKLVFTTYLRLKIEGRQNLPDGPFLICSNHQSHLDAIILGHIGTYYFSKSALIAAKDYWYDEKVRFQSSRFFFNIIPINRRDHAPDFNPSDVIRLLGEFLDRQGKAVVILPEGTRSKDGTIGPFKQGVVRFSRQLNLPVVPVYIHNSAKYWPRGSWFLRPGSLRIRVGKPIFPDEAGNTPDRIREEIMALKKNE